MPDRKPSTHPRGLSRRHGGAPGRSPTGNGGATLRSGRWTVLAAPWPQCGEPVTVEDLLPSRARGPATRHKTRPECPAISHFSEGGIGSRLDNQTVVCCQLLPKDSQAFGQLRVSAQLEGVVLLKKTCCEAARPRVSTDAPHLSPLLTDCAPPDGEGRVTGSPSWGRKPATRCTSTGNSGAARLAGPGFSPGLAVTTVACSNRQSEAWIRTERPALPSRPEQQQAPLGAITPARASTGSAAGRSHGSSPHRRTAGVATHVALRQLGLHPDHDVMRRIAGIQCNRTAAALSNAVQATTNQPRGSLELPTSLLMIVTENSHVAGHRSFVQAWGDLVMRAIVLAKQDRHHSPGLELVHGPRRSCSIERHV